MKKLILIAVAALLFACQSSNSPEKTLKQFFDYTFEMEIANHPEILLSKSGDPLSEKELKEYGEFVEWGLNTSKEEHKLEKIVIENFEVVEVKYNEAKDKATIKYKLSIQGIDNGDDNAVSKKMVKVDDAWRVVVEV